MTVGVLTTSFPRHAGDFAGCFVDDFARAEAAAGHTVEVIAAAARDAHHDRVQPSSLRAGETTTRAAPPPVRVWRVDVPVPRGSAPLFYGDGAPEALEHGGAATWMQATAFWAGLCELTRQRSPGWTRIAAHWLVPCGLAARASAPHLPATLFAHSGDVALLERMPGGGALGRWLARPGADLVFVSGDLQRRFARLTGLEVGRVKPAATLRDGGPHPPPERERAALRATLGLDRESVLAVGRLVPIKGFDVLLRAVALATPGWMAGGRGRATVVILGDGPERARLQAMARGLDVDLRLPGFVPRDDVSRWMAAADVYVQPSRRLSNGRTEGLPVAAVEALRARLPIVASATGGLPELNNLYDRYNLSVRPDSRGRVRLVPPGDPRALAAALLLAISRPDRNLALGA